MAGSSVPASALVRAVPFVWSSSITSRNGETTNGDSHSTGGGVGPAQRPGGNIPHPFCRKRTPSCSGGGSSSSNSGSGSNSNNRIDHSRINVCRTVLMKFGRIVEAEAVAAPVAVVMVMAVVAVVVVMVVVVGSLPVVVVAVSTPPKKACQRWRWRSWPNSMGSATGRCSPRSFWPTPLPPS